MITVWAVVWQNYEPPEVESLWETEDLAQTRAEELNDYRKTRFSNENGGWCVRGIKVSGGELTNKKPIRNTPRDLQRQRRALAVAKEWRVKRVYVAGAYSADNVITVLDNMRRGMREGTRVLLAGFSPFVPWFDFHFQLMLQDGELLTVEDYYEYSIAWLEVSDAIYVIPGSDKSRGTKAEIALARKLSIPIFFSLNDLIQGR